MAVAALDPLVRNAEWRVRSITDRLLLMRDGHIHHDAIEPFDLVRIDPGLRRMLAQAKKKPFFTLAIAEWAGAVELRERNFFDDFQTFRQQRDDLTIDVIDAI